MDKRQQTKLLDEWLDRHCGIIFKVVRAYAFETFDQDDLFQEIVVQLWKSIPRFKSDCSEPTWIYRVALNAALNWSKKERKHRKRETLSADMEMLLNRPPPRKSHHPKLEWLYDQIGQMNEIDRSVTLLLLEGYSYREISGILGITESNVGVKINRIKKRLSSASEQEGKDA